MRTLVLLLAALPLTAQPQPQERPHFEVASIKPNKTGAARVQNDMLVYAPGGRFEAINVTLVDVIVRVYPTRRIQMQGGPDWIDSERFDIIAKPGADAGDLNYEQRRAMVQTLLEDRFRLAFHKETREVPVLAVMVGKNPPKLAPAKEEEETLVRVGDHGQIIFQKVGVIGLVNTVSNIWHTPVIDRTGVEGRFDFTLDVQQFATPPSADGPARREDFGDLVRTAVEQLGFKLEKQKAPLEITIIDRAERPSEN
jgi:uncharacterized protein (TIGR03435 family)